MRHRVKKHLHFKKKDQDHRRAMIRNLLTSLFQHKSLMTTEKRALAIVWEVDRLINVVNSKDARNAIREVMSLVYTKQASLELFNRIAPAFAQIRSGMTRITPIKYRAGDNAKLVQIEFASETFALTQRVTAQQLDEAPASEDKTPKKSKTPAVAKKEKAPIAKKTDGTAKKAAAPAKTTAKPAARNRAPKSKG